jgi:hypothetical protein
VALVASGFTDMDEALATAETAGFPLTNPNQIAFLESQTKKSGG